ncbi:MAG: hypothetical protein M3P89_10455 [Actinomycetota bacterium]|nr:hypothetical protein [Actinomycetota bacterium]
MSTHSLLRARLPSAGVVAVGLAAGFGIAQGTGIRALGGAVFVGTGLAAGLLWYRRRGIPTAVALGIGYVGAFVAAHLLALGVGLPGWLAVSLVTISAAGVTYAVADSPRTAVAAR